MSGPSFTCDHCSATVDLLATRCPSCGHFFDAVRCPRCGHQGQPQAFTQGCPSCRYLAPTVSPSVRRPPADPHRLRPPSRFGPIMAVLLVLLGLAVATAWFLRAG